MIKPKEGEPLWGPSAVRWMKLSIAGLYGVKGGHQVALEWFSDNEEDIVKGSVVPKEVDLWMQADKPWQFLQASREWAKYIDNPMTPLNHLLYQDGSCNGIQHFSAMRRDPIGAKSTNLFPSEEPQDIYSDIIQVCQGYIANIDHEMAQWWRDVETSRDTVKRPVMCLPYGLTQFSCQNYVEDWIIETKADTNRWKSAELAHWFNEYVWKALRTHLRGPSEVMDYLQLITGILSKQGLTIEWVTPLGFIVDKVHYSYKKSHYTVNMKAAGGNKRVRLVMRNPTTVINTRKAKSSIAPNFVHSYDATHLDMVALRLKEAGVPGMCAVHDSIGVHPNYGDQLFDAIRETFVELYQDRDVLQEFKTHLEGLHGLELPEPPPLNADFDFSQILSSPYFFS